MINVSVVDYLAFRFLLAGTYGYGNALGMHAFGLVENGSYSFAEEQADMAMGKQPKDMWAVHAMSHVYEMQVLPRRTAARRVAWI